MNLPQPLKDLGKSALTKVADKFVDFIITKYTGKSIKVFEAEGDIEADKVKTKWEVLEKPFWLQAEAAKMNRQYSNLGNVLKKATPLITSQETNVTDDNDFFWGLLEHSKEISNDEMQTLIAKILAGEYNKPGSYSMQTLQIVKMLGKPELELFEKICNLLLNNEFILYETFNINKDFFKEIGINFGSFQILQNLGLFLPNDMIAIVENPQKENYTIEYYDKKLIFAPLKNASEEITYPKFYSLSTTGKQILPHIKPKADEYYFNWLKLNFQIKNYKLIDNTQQK